MKKCTIRVLHWNILFQEPIENIVKLIREFDPDIICLQELARQNVFNPGTPNTAEYVREALGYHGFFVPAGQWTDAGGTEPGGILTFQNGIFSRFELTDTKVVTISDQGRAYIEATVVINRKPLTIATTHLSYIHNFEITPEKRAEVDIVTKLVKNRNRLIFTGDLNSMPGSYTTAELEKYLAHSGPDYREKTWTTKPFSYNGFIANTLDWRLDYVFASKDLGCLSSKIIPTVYSDHLPILAEFEV